MADVMSVDAAAVGQLNRDTLKLLVNFLLNDEAARRQPRPQVWISEGNDERDGGIDAVVEKATDSAWLPEGKSVWQVKGGRTLTDYKVKRELRARKIKTAGTDVRAEIASGASYVVVWNGDPQPAVKAERHTYLAGAVDTIRKGASSRIVFADKIAEWVNNVPAALKFFPGRGFPNVRALAAEEQLHPTEYSPDPSRTEAITLLQQFMEGELAGMAHLRIEGQPGVGKTRAVIEGCRSELDRVLYTDDVPTTLFDELLQRPDAYCQLVIDDLDDPVLLGRVEHYSQLIGPRLRLVTIGHDKVRSKDTSTIVLAPIDEASLMSIIHATSPMLDDTQARTVARFCRGYVKLAILVADEVSREASPKIVNAIASAKVSEILERLFTPEHRKVLMAMSLLKRVGWDGEVAAEGAAVCTFIGIDRNDARIAVSALERRGVITPQQRYRYVTPEALALMMAKEAWDAFRDKYSELLMMLPSDAARQSVIERLAELRGEPEAERIAEDFLGPAGPFKNLSDLDKEFSATLFRTLAVAAPGLALRRLEYLFARAGRAGLTSFKVGRRQVVWLLEELLQWKETGMSAAQLLLQLAASENETWSNNATGTWKSFFLTRLGGTEIPALERLPLVEDAMRSEDPVLRRLAVTALDAALQGSEFGRGAGDRDYIPPALWRPRTFGESWDYRRRALELLDTLRNDADESVRASAVLVFLHSMAPMADHGLRSEILDRLRSFEPTTEDERKLAWEETHRIEQWLTASGAGDDLAGFLQNLREVRQRLLGDSLPDRLRRFVGGMSWVDWDDAGGTEQMSNRARALADEVVADRYQLTTEDLDWFVSGKAELVWDFGQRLGVLDARSDYLPSVIGAALSGPDPRLASAYLRGVFDRGDRDSVTAVLDELSRRQTSATLAFDATLRGEASDGAVERLLSLVDRGWVASSALSALSWMRWASSLSVVSVEQVLDHLSSDGSVQALEAGIEIVLQRIGVSSKSLRGPLLTQAWGFLEQPSQSDGAMLQYHWHRLATLLLERNVPRVARAVLRWVETTTVALHNERLKVLVEAAKIDAPRTWRAFQRFLLSDGSAPWRIGWWAWEANFVDFFEPSLLASWIAVSPKTRSVALAHLCKPQGTLSPIIRHLIITTGPEGYPSSIIAGNFASGTWAGEHSTRETSRLVTARGWLNDPADEVRIWAQIQINGIEAELPRIRREEEESLGR